MTETRLGHIVFSTYNAWGHVKAACPLICKIARRKNVYITFIVPATYFERVNTEIDKRFEPGLEDSLRAIIRVVGVEAGQSSTDSEEYMYMYQKNMAEACKTLINGKSLGIKPGNDNHINDLGSPSLFILDHMLKSFGYDTMGEIRKLTDGRTPILALATGGAVSTFSLCAPESLGGCNYLLPDYQVIEQMDEKARKEEWSKLSSSIRKELVELPGLPPMYDYEFKPQKLAFEFDLLKDITHSYKFFSECDGVILNANADFEQPAIDAWNSWFTEKPVISPGPTAFPLTETEKKPSNSNSEVTKFLDLALEKQGECSVFYISFGSLFWPKEPEKLWVVLNILLERKIPFLFAHASPFAVVPPEILGKIKESGIALESSWMPQNEILRHKACGWFISHCGHNSMTEAICAGIPIIAWPFSGDQPASASYISSVHKLGYELFEVRSGYGTLPIARLDNYSPVATVDAVRSEFNGVLDKALGDDGKEKRKNVCIFQKKMADSWKPGGASWKEIDRIVEVALSKN